MPAFWSAFLHLFVAVDVVDVLPVYLGFVAALDEPARRRIVLDATLTAAGVGGGACSWGMLVRVIGEAGARAVAKVFELLLAAIGVTLVRRGVDLALQEASRGLPQAWN